jgi:hypothetical protein
MKEVHSPSTYYLSREPMLRRPVESKQFTSWAFTERARASGLVPSMCSIGDCVDNAMMESLRMVGGPGGPGVADDGLPLMARKEWPPGPPGRSDH